MQLKAPLLVLVACATVSLPPASAADPLVCGRGYTHATIVEGSASTVNVSAVKQIGHLCLKMEDDKKRVVFDDCGALIGTVTETANGLPSKLSHTAVFEILESFKTVDDQVAQPVEPDPENPTCAFKVSEQLSKLKWGTGVFRGGSINATATGRVSFCPWDNQNTFELTGDACLMLRR